MDLIYNDYFHMKEEEGVIFIAVSRKGYSLSKLDHLVREHRRITITNFAELKAGLEQATSEKIRIGEWKPLISVSIGEDKMVAKIRIHVTEVRLYSEREIIDSEPLHTHGINYGVSAENIVAKRE